MLTGLIFATDDADDRPESLAATLRFGGSTLIEYQARLLIAHGAGQIIIAVARVTPELLGAVNRIARRGVAVDVVRSAAEANAKLHPLARLVVIADGLVTTDAILAPFAAEGEDALLVTSDADALPGFERVDAASCWAGVARLDAQRLAETVALPRDYDFQSSLLRVAAQSGARRITLAVGSGRAGHGIERDSRSLAARGKAAFAALADDRVTWVDRWLLAPLARLALPQLAAREVPDIVLLGGGAVAALGGGVALISGWEGSGLALSCLSIVLLWLGGMLGWLHGEARRISVHHYGIIGVSALSLLLLGRAEDAMRGTVTGISLAFALVIAGALLERAALPRVRRRWWGSPAAYPLMLLPFALVGETLTGLAATALYAAASLAAAIEALRKQP